MEKTVGILRMGDGDLLSLLSGAGTPQVDIVFYVILHSMSVGFICVLDRPYLPYQTDVYRAQTG